MRANSKESVRVSTPSIVNQVSNTGFRRSIGPRWDEIAMP